MRGRSPTARKRDGVPAGKVEKSRIKSAILKNEHALSIYTPPGYRKDGRQTACWWSSTKART